MFSTAEVCLDAAADPNLAVPNTNQTPHSGAVRMKARGGPDSSLRISRREFIQGAVAAGPIMSSALRAGSGPGATQLVSLDGTWKLYFDRQGRWAKKDWIADFLSRDPRPVQIPWSQMRAEMEGDAIEFRVPATWEEYRPDTTGDGWYWREVVIPKAEFPRSVRLVFNAVRWGAEVFWDGRRVGLYLGGFTPFTVNVSSVAEPGTHHELAVHVVNPGGGFAGDWEKLFFENIQIPQSHNFGGIWQPVEMIVTRPVFIEDVFVEPRTTENVAVAHVTIRNYTPQTQKLSLHARALLNPSAARLAGTSREEVQVGRSQKLIVSMPLKLDPLVLWEPANPARYRLEVNLRSSSPAIQDDHAVTFGMRAFTVEGRFFFLMAWRPFPGCLRMALKLSANLVTEDSQTCRHR